MPTPVNPAGVLIESGAQDWQIFQQDASGRARVTLSGRFSDETPDGRFLVFVRVLDETRGQAVCRTLDWAPAETRADRTWSAVLNVPCGGLYRIETVLQVNGGPIEWARRGDIIHHVGVGDVWVLAGQSNCAGYGKSPACDPPELGLHVFRAAGTWALAMQPLNDSTGSRYPASREGANASHSPGLAFARRLKQALGYPIGLIPAALGGSPLAAWVRGDDGRLYDNMIAWCRDAGLNTCAGMIWYQGESDTSATTRYAERFGKLVRDFRADMGDPALPVLTVQLNRYIGEPFDRPVHAGWEVIREIQRQLARNLDRIGIVSIFDVALSDGIHNNSAANLVLGERLAEAALGIRHNRDITWHHPDLETVRREGPSAIELTFAHVDGRLHFENNIPQQFPFRIDDDEGTVPVSAWRFTGKAVLRIECARAIGACARITGAPTAAPESAVPFDISGYRPMLAFQVPIPQNNKRRPE